VTLLYLAYFTYNHTPALVLRKYLFKMISIRPSAFLFLLLLPAISSSEQISEQCFADHSITSPPDSYQVIARYPHDPLAFTQGMVIYNDSLFESTGLLHKSEVRKINITEGELLLKTDITDIYFGEGLTLLNQQLVQMSLKSGKVFFFDPETLILIKRMTFGQDVWGSTTVNNQMLISNGTSNLMLINPQNLSINKTIKITLNNKALSGLNELEYAEGYVYANVWPTPCIVKIDLVNGKVLSWFNLSKLYPDKSQLPLSAVLNGIAYHQQTKHFFVTGKFWPFLYEIKLQPNEH